MPRLCAFGCRPSGASMHRFPDPDKFPDRFKMWVSLVGGNLGNLSDYEYYKKERVCDLHFTDKDRNRCNRLNALAVPSLCLGIQSAQMNMEDPPTLSQLDERSSQPSTSYLSKTGIQPRQMSLANSPILTELDHRICQPSTSSEATKANAATSITFAANAVLDEHNYSAFHRTTKRHTSAKGCVMKMTPGFNHVQTSYLRSKIKYLRSEVSRLQRKSGTFKTRLGNASKFLDNTTFQQVVQHNMTKPAQLLVHMQLQKSKKPKGRRFTLEEKILSLSLYKKSPKCYPLLQKYFVLPSVKAMKTLLSKIKLSPGINLIIFEKIKKTILEKDIPERLCSLSFDEMSLATQIHYNAKKDTLEGFATNNESRFADHVLVFMVKGVKQSFKQPIAYYFTSRLTKLELKQLIISVITHAQNSGLIILNTVCDQCTANVGAISSLVEETRSKHLRQGKEWRYNMFCINGRKIIPLYDTPHLIKGIRNNLLTKDMQYTTNSHEKTVKWEYYQRVYAADKSYGELRLLHKITEEHVNPEKINKMKVKSATQIFSHSVAVVTEHLTGRGDLPVECKQLIDITLLLDNLFDSLNVSTLHVPNGKKYKGPIKTKSPHHELWREAITVLNTIKFIKKECKGNKIRFIESNVPSVTNLIKTIQGMEAIWTVLSRKYRYDAMLTRNFNQDPVENFFGNIRSYGSRNNSPNTIGFEGAFKALLLNNYSAPHSKMANCEEDRNDFLENLDFFLKESSISTASDVPNENEININENIFIYNEGSDAGQRNYVCGWVLTRCLKNICKSCQNCRKTLLDAEDKNTNNDFIKAKEYNKKKWLCYPSKALEVCFQDLQNITQTFLEKNVKKQNIRQSIIMVSNVLVEYPFSCPTHKEQLIKYFGEKTVNLIIYSWCRSINRILAGKISYEGIDEVKIAAVNYCKKHKHHKNKK